MAIFNSHVKLPEGIEDFDCGIVELPGDGLWKTELPRIFSPRWILHGAHVGKFIVAAGSRRSLVILWGALGQYEAALALKPGAAESRLWDVGPPEIHMARGRLENCCPPKMSTSCYFHWLCTILYHRECENGYLDFVTQITRKLASASWSCFCLSKVDGRQEPGTANNLTTSHLYCILTW